MHLFDKTESDILLYATFKYHCEIQRKLYKFTTWKFMLTLNLNS